MNHMKAVRVGQRQHIGREGVGCDEEEEMLALQISDNSIANPLQ